MRRTRSTTLAALAVLALSAGVAAQQTVQDRTTFVTFSAPVAIPGRTLPAGTYTFLCSIHTDMKGTLNVTASGSTPHTSTNAGCTSKLRRWSVATVHSCSTVRR